MVGPGSHLGQTASRVQVLHHPASFLRMCDFWRRSEGRKSVVWGELGWKGTGRKASIAREQCWGKEVLSGQWKNINCLTHPLQSHFYWGRAFIILSPPHLKPLSSYGTRDGHPEDRWKWVERVTGVEITLDWQGGRRQEASPIPFSSVSPTSPSASASWLLWYQSPIPITTTYSEAHEPDLLALGRDFFEGRGCCSTSRKVPSRRKKKSRLTAERPRVSNTWPGQACLLQKPFSTSSPPPSIRRFQTQGTGAQWGRAKESTSVSIHFHLRLEGAEGSGNLEMFLSPRYSNPRGMIKQKLIKSSLSVTQVSITHTFIHPKNI